MKNVKKHQKRLNRNNYLLVWSWRLITEPYGVPGSPLGGNTYPLKLQRETGTRAPRQPLVNACWQAEVT